MQISVIIPMYNESKVIEKTAALLSKYMSEHFESYEILFSDDGSTDGCAALVQKMRLPCVRVLKSEENQGKGAAVRRGMMEAEGALVLFTDADLAYGVEVIGRFYDFYTEQKKSAPIHVVVGSRNLDPEGYENYSVLRRIMSKLYLRILCLLGGLRLSDSQCGCKAFERDVAREIFSRCQVKGYAFDFEAILWAEQLGFTLSEIPVRVLHHDESKVHILRDSFRMLCDLMGIKKSIRRTSKEKYK